MATHFGFRPLATWEHIESSRCVVKLLLCMYMQALPRRPHQQVALPMALTAGISPSCCRFWAQAMKNAFALRMSLGDPGPDPSNPFVNTTKQDALLHDTLSRKFADSLRCAN